MQHSPPFSTAEGALASKSGQLGADWPYRYLRRGCGDSFPEYRLLMITRIPQVGRCIALTSPSAFV